MNYTLLRTRQAITRNEFNDKGYLIKESNFNYEEKLTPDNDSVSIYLYERDVFGRNISESYFRSASEPTNCKGGYHKIVYLYDNCGRIIQMSFWGINGLAVMNEEGYSSVKYRHNRYGQAISEEYYDELGRPALLDETYDAIHFTYDERGYQISRSFHKGGTLVKNHLGIAVIKEVRDESNKLMEKYYFDENGNPINSTYGFHKTIYRYDRFLNFTEEKYNLLGKKIS